MSPRATLLSVTQTLHAEAINLYDVVSVPGSVLSGRAGAIAALSYEDEPLNDYSPESCAPTALTPTPAAETVQCPAMKARAA